MALVNKINSNIVGLRYAEETSPRTLPATPVWKPLAPNSFSNFGAQLTTISRNPLSPSRQRKKGNVSDLEASGGFAADLTQENFQDLLQGFLFADLRKKTELDITAANSTTKAFSGTISGLAEGAILMGEGFANEGNNGVKHVVGVTSSAITVNETLVTETVAPTGSAKVVQVGQVLESGDGGISVAGGAKPALTSSSLDFTTLSLIPGEWIYIGGDISGTSFASAGNNGFKRIFSIQANRIEFDKSQGDMTTDDGSGKTIALYFGRVCKNETSQIKTRTYQIERTLGAPDPSKPSEIQAEYLTGAMPGEFTINIPQAEKIALDVSFTALDAEQRTATEGVKSGTRPTLTEGAAFNSSSDVMRTKLSLYDPAEVNPSPFINFFTDLTITVNNNPSALKAVGVLGAFDVSAGTFEVSGSFTAYFTTVDVVQAVRNNADVTFDLILLQENKGIAIDLPLITLGDAQASIEQNQAITLPITFNAVSGVKLDSNLDHTILFVFFDYLPSAAAA